MSTNQIQLERVAQPPRPGEIVHYNTGTRWLPVTVKSTITTDLGWWSQVTPLKYRPPGMRRTWLAPGHLLRRRTLL